MDRYENVQRNSVVRPNSRHNNPRRWEELGVRRKSALEKEKEKNYSINNATRLSFRYYFENRRKHPFYDETYENKYDWYRWKPIVPHSGKDQLPKHIREISRRTMKRSEEHFGFYTLAMWEEVGNPDIFQQYQTHIRNVPSYDLVSVDNTLNNSRWLEHNLGEILDKLHANKLMNPHFDLHKEILHLRRKRQSIDEELDNYQCGREEYAETSYHENQQLRSEEIGRHLDNQQYELNSSKHELFRVQQKRKDIDEKIKSSPNKSSFMYLDEKYLNKIQVLIERQKFLKERIKELESNLTDECIRNAYDSIDSWCDRRYNAIYNNMHERSKSYRERIDTLSKQIEDKEKHYESLVCRVPYFSFLEKLRKCTPAYLGRIALKEWKILTNCYKTYKKSSYRKMFKHWKLLCKLQREKRRRLYEQLVKSR